MAEIVIQRKRQRSVWPWLLGLLVLALLPLLFMAADRDDRPATRPATARRDTTVRRDTAALRDTTAPRAATAGGVAAPAGGAAGEPPRSAERGPAPSTPGAAAPAVTPSVDRTTATAAGSVAPTASGTPARAGEESRAAPMTFDRFIAARAANLDDREHREFSAEALRLLADELRELGASAAGVRAIRANADSLLMPRARRSAQPDYARAAFLAAVREFDVLRGRYAAPVDTGRLRAAAWAVRPNVRLHAQQGRVRSFLAAARDALNVLARAPAARQRGR